MNKLSDTGNALPLLPDLQEAARRLEQEADRHHTWQQHTETIRRSLTVRGEPFGQHDRLILTGGAQVIEIPVECLPAILGTGRLADYNVQGEGVSRKHARLSKEGVFLRVEDMQSKNGTFLNDRLIHSDYLCEGDSISMGAAQFKVERG